MPRVYVSSPCACLWQYVHLHTRILRVYSKNVYMCFSELICMCACDIHALQSWSMVVLIHSTDGGVQTPEKTASLYVLLRLTHADWLCWPCRWTTFDLPCWPLSGGKGYWSQASWLSHVLSWVAMNNMLSNDNGIFLAALTSLSKYLS